MLSLYSLESPKGEILYIGQTNNPARRYFEHDRLDLTMRVLATSSSREVIDDLEIHLIAYCRAKGYSLTNISPGGSRGLHAPETLLKMSLLKKGKPGAPRSAETRAKIGAANRGRLLPPLSAEARKRRSQANLGRRHSNSSREKMRQSHLGEKKSQDSIEKRSQTRREIVYVCECGESYSINRRALFRVHKKSCSCGKEIT